MLGLLVVVAGCSSELDRTDGGGVLLSVSEFDGLPIAVSVNATVAAGGFVQIEELEVQNVAKDPTGVTSDLMNVEIQSYEVTFSRADTGTRLPPPFVRGLFGIAPVNGTFDVENLPIMSIEQLGNVPLSDLLFENGGFDKETGSDLIVLNLRLRFFGRTLSGDAVESTPALFTVEFTV
jgi:hypothetical protein